MVVGVTAFKLIIKKQLQLTLIEQTHAEIKFKTTAELILLYKRYLRLK
jgi:hypothetical protein